MQDTPDTYSLLRATALNAVALGLPAPPVAHPAVSGMVIDIPAGDGEYATLVAMGDDSTSLYTSTGAGRIGAGAHPAVASATHRLLATAEALLGGIVEEASTDHPPAGCVRMFVLTPAGRRRADCPENAFWGREEHVLTPLILAAQNVISELSKAGPA